MKKTVESLLLLLLPTVALAQAPLPPVMLAAEQAAPAQPATPELVGARVEALKDMVRLTLTASEAVGAVEANFVTRGRFTVVVPARLTEALEKRLEVAKGAVVEIVLAPLETDPARTRVTLILNTPVPCRAVTDAATRTVQIEAQNPPPRPGPPGSPHPQFSAQGITLDFVAAELRDVFAALALQSGRNIVVSPGVQGETTVHLGRVTLQKALDILCKLHGLRYREVEDVYLVGTTEEIEKAFAADKQVEIVRVTGIDLAKATGILTKARPQLEVEAQEPNTLVLIGVEEDVAAAKGLLAEIADGGPQAKEPGPNVLEILEVHHAKPDQVQGLLSKLLPNLTLQVQEGLPSLAAVGTAADLAEAQRLLTQLDVAPVPPTVEIVPLIGVEAQAVVAVLQKAQPGLTAEAQGTDRVALIGAAEEIQQARELIERMVVPRPAAPPPLTRVLKLAYLPADKLKNVLTRALPQASVETVEGMSAVVVVGGAEDVQRAEEIRQQLDVPEAAPPPAGEAQPPPPQTEARLLQHVDLEEARRLLAETWPDLKLTTSPAFRVLTMTGRAEEVTAAEALLEQLDVAPPEPAKGPPEVPPEEAISQVYERLRLEPEEIKTMIEQALPSVSVKVLSSGAVRLTGREEDMAQAMKLIAQADVPSEHELYKVRYVAVDNLEQILKTHLPGLQVDRVQRTPPQAGDAGGGGGLLSPRMGGGAGGGGGEGTGGTESQAAWLLLLTGTRRELDQALALLAQVDTPAPQVSIEAVISDISPETIGALGIDWNAPLTTVQITETAGDGLKFGSFDRRGMTLNAAVEAIRTDSRSKLLAQPNVATVEGMGARILSGQRIPYETRNIIGGEVVVSVQFEQVGVNLMITPKVPLDGQVEARIRAEVSSFQAFTSSGFPIVSTREAEATVRVADGGIIAIGGLMREEELATLRKVPFLSDIPILGELFKFRSQTKRLTELVILISCRVLPDKE